jgi:hypothetical protein
LSSCGCVHDRVLAWPITSAAARNNVPAVYELSEYVKDVGLLS